jgi:hypothetical protein
MDKYSEIANTGFFFSRLPDGGLQFGRRDGEGGEMQPMEPEEFASSFGGSVESEELRQEAAKILEEYNRQYKTKFTLSEFQRNDENNSMVEQDKAMQQQQGMLGQAMTGA